VKRKKRTEILIKGRNEIAHALAGQIKVLYEIKVLEEPNFGLVMVKMRETAQKCLFYLGEVLVTECKVQINGFVGIGIATGNDKELAYNLSIIDAAYNAGLKETESWDAMLMQEEEAILRRAAASGNKIMKTRVNFETMNQ